MKDRSFQVFVYYTFDDWFEIFAKEMPSRNYQQFDSTWYPPLKTGGALKK